MIEGDFKMKMPTNIVPMGASPGYMAFNDPQWAFEIKLDGYRLLAYVDRGYVKLQTRNLKDYTSKFPQIVSALQKWKRSAILDGEIVALNDNGISDFNTLQNWRSDEDGPLYYFVFDLLWLDGKDYMNEPLYRRKSTLKNLLPKSVIVLYQDEIITYGKPCFEMAKREGLEGIVAKKIDSLYKPATRSKDWLKIKATRDRDFIICGYTKNVDTGMPFSTLILGGYQEQKLHFVGEVGSGFTDRLMKEIIEKLHPIKKCPFQEEPRLTNHWRKKKPDYVVWCKPKFVCTIKFQEWTKAGELRHQSFRCLRPDINAQEVVLS
jgi:bifunctional non-homologous end joining protein LigD